VFNHVGFFLRSSTMVMGVIGWIVLGLIAGYIAGTQVNKDGEGLPMKIGVGIAGAVIGGWLFTTFSPTEGTEFNLWSLLVAVVGAVVFLVVWHAIRRSASHA
jgi:uncharacterized membrane protein YeaQ/YmgE (transglycosylase-associated protein family)